MSALSPLFAASLLLNGSASPSRAGVWLDTPVAIDEGISPAVLETIGKRLREALGRAGEIGVRYGALGRLEPGDAAVGDHLLSAGELLRQGEDLYMGSEYAPAAASLAESAVLYTNTLAKLSAEDISRLYRAHLLAGLAWIEAGQRDQAKAAFKKLLTIRPDFEPDPELMPPHGRVVFREALSEIRATGLRSLVIRTDPEGAEVLIDGLARGKTPITLTGLPVGTHGLRLVLAGYQTVEADVVLPATEQQSEYSAELHQTLRMAAYRRVRAAVRRGKAVDDVAEDIALLTGVLSPQVVFVGAARAEVGWVVVARRWYPAANETSAAYAVLESLDDLAPLDELARLLLKSTWPAIHVPPDAEPLTVDFARAVLGVSDQFGRSVVSRPTPFYESLWFWGGVTLATGVAVATVMVFARPDGPRREPDTTEIHLDFQ